MKTVRQIADEIGVPKQRVYRFIKKECINEAHQQNGVMYYDEAAEFLIKQGFSETDASVEVDDAHRDTLHDTVTDVVIGMLQQELDAKSKQIESLQSELAKEREHNREKDKQLLDTLSKLADSQAALSAGQAADKQKALAEKLIEGQQIQGGDEGPVAQKHGMLERIFLGRRKKQN